MITKSAAKYDSGGVTKPKALPGRENGNMIPMATIKIEVKIKNLLGLLSIKGILPVRIMCITSV